jgi:hypothetical protein
MEETKPWYTSQTILSLIGVVAGVVVPKYAPIIPQLAGDVFTIVSAVSAGIGRIRARKRVSK